MAETGTSDGPGVTGVAGRYATALFELARESDSIDAVARDLETFAALLADSGDLRRLIASPVITADDQVRAVGAILDRAGIAGLAGNLIRLIAVKKRLFALPSMIRAYRALVAKGKGIVPAEIRLAEQPSPQILEEIKGALREMAGSDVDVAVKIDPSLIGGLVIKVGSRMVDASLRTKLNSIRLAMKEAR